MDNKEKAVYWGSIRKLIRQTLAGATTSPFSHVFLLGAGTSVSSQIPDGRTMCQELMRQYEITDNEVRKIRRKEPWLTRYQVVFRAVREKEGDRWVSYYVRNQIRKARRPKPDGRWIINNCYNTLANILVEKKRMSRVVLTTNFDPLLYYAFVQNWTEEPIIIRHPEELSLMEPEKIYEEFPVLIYLHGYWQNHWQYHEPSNLKNYAQRWLRGLRKILPQESVNVIGIGYSGTEDSIAIEWLKERLRHGTVEKVWWCVYRPGKYPTGGYRK